MPLLICGKRNNQVVRLRIRHSLLIRIILLGCNLVSIGNLLNRDQYCSTTSTSNLLISLLLLQVRSARQHHDVATPVPMAPSPRTYRGVSGLDRA